MGNLHAFLHPALPEEREVVISDRFKNEDGTVAAFRIRAISQEENERLSDRATHGKGNKRELDASRYLNSLVVAGTVYPDFSDSELCAAYGVLDPAMVPGRMLLAGEFSKLADAISALSGIGESAVSEAAQEAKN